MPVTTIRREETLLLKGDGSEVVPLTSQTSSAHQPVESNNKHQTSIDNQNSDHKVDDEAMVSFAEEPSADQLPKEADVTAYINKRMRDFKKLQGLI